MFLWQTDFNPNLHLNEEHFCCGPGDILIKISIQVWYICWQGTEQTGKSNTCVAYHHTCKNSFVYKGKTFKLTAVNCKLQAKCSCKFGCKSGSR